MSDAGLDSLLRILDIQGKMLERALEQLSASAPPPPPPPVSQLKELLEVVAMLQPQAPQAPAYGPDAPAWLPLVSRAIEALERINTRPAAPAQLAAPPAPQPEATRVAIPRWLAPIVPFIGVITNWADTGGRPELRAQIVADELPPQARQTLVAMLQGDGFPSNIIAAVPAFQARERWMVPFLYALRAALVPGSAPAPEGEPQDTEGELQPAPPANAELNGA